MAESNMSVLEYSNAWLDSWEPEGAGFRLRIALSGAENPLSDAGGGFRAVMDAGGVRALMAFGFLASVRGEAIYEAQSVEVLSATQEIPAGVCWLVCRRPAE